MKKSIYLLLTLTLFVLLPFSVSADEIIGEVYTTDITAYINGYEIPAYNIGGSVAVAVADLRNYGFTVEYDNTLRQSSVVLNPDTAQISPLASEQQSDLPLGTKVMNVFASDIVVKLNGTSVDSFNIGGRMAVKFSDLKKFGTHVYDNDERTTNLWIKELPYFIYTKQVISEGKTPLLAAHLTEIQYSSSGWSSKNGKSTEDNHVVNAMISHILGRLIEDGMTDIEKINAIYEYIVTDYKHEAGGSYRIPTKWEDIAADFFSKDSIIFGMNLDVFKSYVGKYSNYIDSCKKGTVRYYDHSLEMMDKQDSNQSDFYTYHRLYYIFKNKSGVCSYYSCLLKGMVNHIGLECNIVRGDYIYNDGSTTEHVWNNILIDGKYYWFDTDLDSINWHNYYSSYDYVVKNYFMKKDSDWTSNHKWNTSYYPKCN